MAVGSYRWVLTQAGDSTKLELVPVGTDVLGVELLPVRYVPADAWSCRCESKMILEAPENVDQPTGLKCAVCLVPVLSVCTCCFEITITEEIPAGLTGIHYFTAVANQDESTECTFTVDNAVDAAHWTLTWNVATKTLTLIDADSGARYDGHADAPCSN